MGKATKEKREARVTENDGKEDGEVDKQVNGTKGLLIHEEQTHESHRSNADQGGRKAAGTRKR